MVSAAMESALNRPVWSALTTGDRRFAEGGALALRFPSDIAPFAATVDDSPEAFGALRELLSPDGRVALVTLDRLKPYPGFEVVREAPIIQMIADGKMPTPPEGAAPIVLGRKRRPGHAASHAADEPRPVWSAHARAWSIHWRSGRRRARRHGWRAHAARRSVEISAVCVSPEHRGKGYAAFLVAWLVRKLRGEGAMPFLHAFTDNPAIALYERLGFTKRKTLRLTVLARAEA